MKELVKSFVKWLLIVLTTLVVITWSFIFSAYCQEVKQEIHLPHPTQEDFEDNVRFVMVGAMSRDDRLLFYRKENRRSVFLGSFAWDKNTKFYNEWKDCVAVLYCKAHNFAYVVQNIEGKHCNYGGL